MVRVEPNALTRNPALDRGAKPLLVTAAAVALLGVGVLASWGASRRLGVDFASLQLTALGLVDGQSIYSFEFQKAVFPERYGIKPPPGMFYPPATGFAVLPFAWLPYAASQFVWFVLLTGAVILGVRALVRLAAPEARSHVWIATAGLVLLSSVIRWGMHALQGAPLVFGLLCAMVLALRKDRPGLALLIGVYATAFKMTLALPFLALLALYRRYVAAAAALATWAALNALGLWRMGGQLAFDQYRANVAVVEAFGDMNTPNPWEIESIPRLDWTYLFYGLSGHLPASRAVTLALSAAVGLWLVREGLRARARLDLHVVSAFLTPAILLGSLYVYHHQYDLCLILVPLLLMAFATPRDWQPRWALALLAPLVVMIAVLPIGRTQRLFLDTFGMTGIGVFNMSFPIVLTCALIGSLVLLNRLLNTRLASVPAPSPEPAPDVPR